MITKELIQTTCPECRGPLSQVDLDEGLPEFECLVGHKYSAKSLLDAHSETQEKVLWSAVVVLEESARLVESVAPHLPVEVADRLRQQASEKLRQAEEVRHLLERLEPFQTE